VKGFLLITSIVLAIACIMFVFLGIYHISQTIGDTSTPVAQRTGITYFAMFFEIVFGVIFGVLSFFGFKKYREY